MKKRLTLMSLGLMAACFMPSAIWGVYPPSTSLNNPAKEKPEDKTAMSLRFAAIVEKIEQDEQRLNAILNRLEKRDLKTETSPSSPQTKEPSHGHSVR